MKNTKLIQTSRYIALLMDMYENILHTIQHLSAEDQKEIKEKLEPVFEKLIQKKAGLWEELEVSCQNATRLTESLEHTIKVIESVMRSEEE